MTQNLELVEKLVEKTGLSYTEAKAALERTDWDILEALIQLEAEGKISGGKTTKYTTNTTEEENKEEKSGKEEKKSKEYRENRENRRKRERCETGNNFKKTSRSFGDVMKYIFDKGNSNCIEMYKNDERKLGIPVTAFVLLLIFCFWVIIPLMIVGLFLGCRYSFSGPELGRDSVNSAMGKATDFAENIKSEFKGNDREDDR